MLRILRRIVLIILSVAVVIALALTITVNVTPNLTVWLLRNSGLFDGEVVAPQEIEALRGEVSICRDVVYPSKYTNNTMDIYAPAGEDAATPTLIWMHGGAFVAGDKEGLEPFAIQLAAQGYTVVSLNYALAPETIYPAAVVQLGEAYAYLAAHADEFTTVDTGNLAFGGDSAGAQIASQFVAVQTNPELAQAMGMAAIVPAVDIKAAVLYCGPYNLADFQKADSKLLAFFVRQLGWAYFGERDWETSPLAEQVSTYDYVSALFPTTFITDGNTGSFEEQGRALQEKLDSFGVETAGLFYPLSDGELPHEYQFNYEQYPEQAQECYEKVLNFLDAKMKDY